MKINKTKNMYYVQKMNFLGYIFIINGVKMDPVKTAIIKN
jgi:hypothetical protein